MPNLDSAKKQMRASNRKRQVNKVVLSLARTSVRRSENLIADGNVKEAEKAVPTTISALDRAAGKGVIHPNNAARRKSRLAKKLNQAQNKKPAK